VQDEATSYFNIASTLEKMEQLPAAQKRSSRRWRLTASAASAAISPATSGALAVVLSKRGQHEAALRLLDHALQQYRSEKDEEGMAAVQLSRGAALRRAGARASFARPGGGAQPFQAEAELRYLDKIYEELG
jgi:tetratricopeptide (TPR) repeat protein